MASSDEAAPRLDLVVATLDRIEPLEALLGALGEQTHRGFPGADRGPERRRPRRASPSSPSGPRRASPALPAGTVARAQRRARAPRGAARRLPGRRLPLPARPARAGHAEVRVGRGARRAQRPCCRRGRPCGRALADNRCANHPRHCLAHRELAHDVPPSGGRRASRRVRRVPRARRRDAVVLGRGDRLPRPCAAARSADRVRPLRS